MATNGKYPEHDKLEKVKDKSQACGEFLEWLLDEKRYQLSEYHTHTDECYDDEGELTCRTSSERLYPAAVNTRKLLAEFFEIDEAKLEEEKVAMLAELRAGR